MTDTPNDSKFSRRELLLGLGAASVAVTSGVTPAMAAMPKGVKWVDYDNPKYTPGTILISNSKRRLLLVHEGGKALRYPVAVGKPSEQWTGMLPVTNKVVGPVWYPTPSMREKNPDLPKFVKAGPQNPMGTHAIYLGWTFYRIHGTNAPGSIGRAASSGCFRMYNSHVKDLYARVHFGAPCHVTG
ncbi:MAG: L,D-transpeptidase [Pseudomonadota bacterium]